MADVSGDVYRGEQGGEDAEVVRMELQREWRFGGVSWESEGSGNGSGAGSAGHSMSILDRDGTLRSLVAVGFVLFVPRDSCCTSQSRESVHEAVPLPAPAISGVKHRHSALNC